MAGMVMARDLHMEKGTDGETTARRKDLGVMETTEEVIMADNPHQDHNNENLHLVARSKVTAGTGAVNGTYRLVVHQGRTVFRITGQELGSWRVRSCLVFFGLFLG